MSVVSSQWTLDALVHIAGQSRNAHLTRFLRVVYEHLENLGWPQENYNAKERYSKLTTVENIWKARVDNIKEAYEAELAKLAASRSHRLTSDQAI
jgi:hypothetical protein